LNLSFGGHACAPVSQCDEEKIFQGENMPSKGTTGKALIALCAITIFVAAGRINTYPKQAPPPGAEVKIDNFSFAPDSLTVAAGTTVKWTNRDDIPHTVVSDDKTTFRSKAMDTDETFSYTFTKPGTYSYFCSIHPKMVAKVIVK
jgi:plastocyanin